MEALNTANSEIIFMKTSSKSLAPFTMYTIPLTSDISVIILLEVNMKLNRIEYLSIHFLVEN
jgi:hypothetical protein